SQHATGTGELTKLVWIDASNRQACSQQDADNPAFVSATGFDADRSNAQATQPPNQLGPAGSAIWDREAASVGQQQHIQAVLRYRDTAMQKLLHLRIPSLLMRARALATVRVCKKRLEHQAHSRSVNRGGYGLPVATGAVP